MLSLIAMRVNTTVIVQILKIFFQFLFNSSMGELAQYRLSPFIMYVSSLGYLATESLSLAQS